MFGTIGHFRPIAGHEGAIKELLAEWDRSIRPSVPGAVTTLNGRCTMHDGEIVAVVLMQDEPTYRALADSPEQDRWYRQLITHLQSEPQWEDIAWTQLTGDGSSRNR